MRKLWQTNKVKQEEESTKSMKSHTQKEVAVNSCELQTLNFET